MYNLFNNLFINRADLPSLCWLDRRRVCPWCCVSFAAHGCLTGSCSLARFFPSGLGFVSDLARGFVVVSCFRLWVNFDGLPTLALGKTLFARWYVAAGPIRILFLVMNVCRVCCLVWMNSSSSHVCEAVYYVQWSESSVRIKVAYMVPFLFWRSLVRPWVWNSLSSFLSRGVNFLLFCKAITVGSKTVSPLVLPFVGVFFNSFNCLQNALRRSFKDRFLWFSFDFSSVLQLQGCMEMVTDLFSRQSYEGSWTKASKL